MLHGLHRERIRAPGTIEVPVAEEVLECGNAPQDTAVMQGVWRKRNFELTNPKFKTQLHENETLSGGTW